MSHGDVHSLAQCASVYTSHGNASGIVGVVQTGNQHLGCTLQLFGCGNVLHDAVQQVADVVGGLSPILAHPSVLGRTVNHGEVQLFLCGIQVTHQIEDHLIHLLGPAVGLVHLVDHHYGLQPYLQGFLQDKACLRHGALEGVHQQNASVGHIEHTFHLSSEVTVSRGVDDVYLGTFVIDGDVLAQDSDAALAFQFVVVQHQIVSLLVLAEQVPRQ